MFKSKITRKLTLLVATSLVLLIGIVIAGILYTVKYVGGQSKQSDSVSEDSLNSLEDLDN